MYIMVSFIFPEDAYFEFPEKRNAHTGHASANVYAIGPQYETLIPVNTKNNTSTNLSITMYIVNSVNI